MYTLSLQQDVLLITNGMEHLHLQDLPYQPLSQWFYPRKLKLIRPKFSETLNVMPSPIQYALRSFSSKDKTSKLDRGFIRTLEFYVRNREVVPAPDLPRRFRRLNRAQ